MEALVVKPVITFREYERKEKRSWRPWGGVQTREDLREEVGRIERELGSLVEKADFPLKILPVSVVEKEEDVYSVEKEADVALVYAASGSLEVLEKVTELFNWTIFFLRHKSGPVYLWYEVIHPRFLRAGTDYFVRKDVTVEDLVVDDYGEVLWRLRALYALKRTEKTKIVAVGGTSGWGPLGRHLSPLEARRKWGLNIVVVTYSELAEKIKEARKDHRMLEESKRLAEEYLKTPGTTLKTSKDFYVNSFLLYLVFKKLLEEYGAKAITINECMATIMPIAETTACLPLSILNDEGYIAFCESDFVVIPAGILLHYISGKPVFLVDPTTPHHGVVTVAHCTAPRKMNGKNYEPADILTHFESDYGAAPKVFFKKGQIVTVVDPDFEDRKWIIFRGKIIESPSLAICRSQIDLEIEGDWKLLLKEMRGFHWVLAYGDYLKELEYALSKKGIEVVNITQN
ncbi:MAG: sugar isomerase [Thermoprotei archaeon]|nr:MAG: sugar isomerase [Thermoprotei archaeon]